MVKRFSVDRNRTGYGNIKALAQPFDPSSPRLFLQPSYVDPHLLEPGFIPVYAAENRAIYLFPDRMILGNIAEFIFPDTISKLLIMLVLIKMRRNHQVDMMAYRVFEAATGKLLFLYDLSQPERQRIIGMLHRSVCTLQRLRINTSR